MKKALYIILLALEFVVGALLLSFMTFFSGWKALLLGFVVWAVLSGLLIAKLKKAENDICRRKLKIFLALAMLIPLVVAIVSFFVIVELYF